MIEKALAQLRGWLLIWLDAQSKLDAEFSKRLMYAKLEMLEREVRSNQENSVNAIRYCTMSIAGIELEQANIEAGHLPCGCFSVTEHISTEGRNHSKTLWNRTRRWLEWRERERNQRLEELHGRRAHDHPAN